ncbi:MAG: sialate O-acetylesterase [Deferribacteres bacterium]|nr:sialate O-acetylesterase [candidate division KSB1 bacterium]MCB9503267.1 sialate O-acetylesterase [Deferribacteres bacterium]
MANKCKVSLFAVLVGLTQPLYSEIKLPKIFADNMVLQRDIPVKIWGWAESGEEVSIAIQDQVLSAIADESGKWHVTLAPMPAGGPFQITISGENTIQLQNILFGDVWVCSGQSNMYFRTAAAKNAYIDINNANYEKIRVFQIDKAANYLPKDDLDSGEWLECSPETVRRFSAVAYFFGREIHKDLDVPIGLIHASWGGSKIQAWLDGETMKKFADYHRQVEEVEQTPDYFEKLEKEYTDKGGNLLIKAIYQQDPGFKPDGTLSDSEFFADNDWKEIKVPGYWEESRLPGYDGTVWYRKRFEIPEAFQIKDLQLDLGWIDDYDFTFFNGKRVGENFYKGNERRYLIPKDNVKAGMNEIVVCVYDTDGFGGFWGPRKSHLKINDDATQLRIDLQGLWQFKQGISLQNLVKPDKNKQPRKRDIPAFLYNAMISPLTQFTIKGAIWYQGESNAGNASEYTHLFPAMIEGWRQAWKQGDFPFFFVQLAGYGFPNKKPGQSGWAELREAQLKTLSLPNTGMAVTIDLGDKMDIHPTNKQEVGRRLALSASKVAYGKDVVYSGPVYDSMEIKDGKIYINFRHIGSGLVTKDKFGYLKEFAIAGADKNFVWAKAFIQDNQVVVFCEDVKEPVAVRYSWSSNPSQANLYNKEGLPASPFRTDSWEN